MHPLHAPLSLPPHENAEIGVMPLPPASLQHALRQAAQAGLTHLDLRGFKSDDVAAATDGPWRRLATVVTDVVMPDPGPAQAFHWLHRLPRCHTVHFGSLPVEEGAMPSLPSHVQIVTTDAPAHPPAWQRLNWLFLDVRSGGVAACEAAMRTHAPGASQLARQLARQPTPPSAWPTAGQLMQAAQDVAGIQRALNGRVPGDRTPWPELGEDMRRRWAAALRGIPADLLPLRGRIALAALRAQGWTDPRGVRVSAGPMQLVAAALADACATLLDESGLSLRPTKTLAALARRRLSEAGHPDIPPQPRRADAGPAAVAPSMPQWTTVALQATHALHIPRPAVSRSPRSIEAAPRRGG